MRASTRKPTGGRVRHAQHPANCREYVTLHQHLGIGPGDDLLDADSGAGLALELAGAPGATCPGIDASPLLVDVAWDRNSDPTSETAAWTAFRGTTVSRRSSAS